MMYQDTYAACLSLTMRDLVNLKITDDYSFHRVVYSLFEKPIENEKTEKGFLFKEKKINGQTKIIMVSNRPPCLNDLKTKYPQLEGALDVKKILPNFLEHSRYQFGVVLNPVKENGQTKKIIPIRGSADLQKWFLERCETHWGFSVEGELDISPAQVSKFKGSKNEKGEKHHITISKVAFTGSLKVMDSVKFQKAFKEGMGKKKGFGCGLLEIVPRL